MKAILLTPTWPRLIFSKVFGRFSKGAGLSRLSVVQYKDVDPPELPNEKWVEVKSTLSGICASDVSGVFLQNNPYSCATAFYSFPLFLGHENVGVVEKLGVEAEGFGVGDRVVIDPTLGCKTREISTPCKPCQNGDYSVCENYSEGSLAPGTRIGSNCQTGGGWSERFVAHYSQLYKIPDEVSDEHAVLMDPFACSLRAVTKSIPQDDDTVLVIGAGTMGLGVIAAIRALGIKCRIISMAKYDWQGEMAQEYGADTFLFSGDGQLYEKIAELTNARIYKQLLGRKMLTGGPDIIFDCVGSTSSITDALKFVRERGTMVLVGAGNVGRIDWEPVWFREINIVGTVGHAKERIDPAAPPRSAYEIIFDWIRDNKVDLAPMLTHKFDVSEYKTALKAVSNRGKSRITKAAFCWT